MRRRLTGSRSRGRTSELGGGRSQRRHMARPLVPRAAVLVKPLEDPEVAVPGGGRLARRLGPRAAVLVRDAFNTTGVVLYY